MAENLELAPDESAPGTARRFVVGWLERWGYDGLVPDVALMTSELATNAVQHVGAPFVVAVEDTGSGVRVTIDDPEPTVPIRRHPAAFDTGGRGLEIIAKLASAWGAEVHDGDGKSVWFEAAG